MVASGQPRLKLQLPEAAEDIWQFTLHSSGRSAGSDRWRGCRVTIIEHGVHEVRQDGFVSGGVLDGGAVGPGVHLEVFIHIFSVCYGDIMGTGLKKLTFCRKWLAYRQPTLTLRMRKPRIKITGETAVYHCIARIVAGHRWLADHENEKLRQLMWEQAEFSGVEIVTYCLMGNHFHVLVRVPDQVSVSDGELVKRLRRFYGPKSSLVKTVEEHFERHGVVSQSVRDSIAKRMGDVSVFMKELKHRFTKWFNKQANRFGTLWAERFKSVLIEDSIEAVSTVAKYIDLNPVRAGLVEDPRKYRFCGFAEAAAGSRLARRGLIGFHAGSNWRSVGPAYQEALAIQSGTANRSDKVVLDREMIRRQLKEGRQVSVPQVLRLRLRYFSDGLVLGSRNYVNEVFAEFRDHFGKKRASGARRMRHIGAALDGLATARDLQVGVVS